MHTWPPDELAILADSEALTLRTGADHKSGVDVGMVLVDGELYVRGFHGTGTHWYQEALTDGVGRIAVGTLARDVTLQAGPGPLAEIDAAYLAKYGKAAAIVENAQARAATLHILPVN
ncbi:DUF2255 family protein [Gordonia sp. TBRC 11910]|uniref:DUF2255 family protein n=1 Tax=Gordonia asplenii TaxID=2725283 RepID=A0A848L3Q1_9ACTN|nr:DUF2255 family protein [Gordonia asplenii]NMO03211.1 DUF2255 family protein [Gordonia asplenii]